MTATPPQGLIHLNTWSPAGSTVWEGLRGVALLQEVCHWEWALRYQKPTPFLVSSLCLVLVDGKWALSYYSSTMPACLPAAMVYIMVMNFLTFLCKLPWTYCFATAITKTAFVSYPEYRWLCLFPLVKEWLHNLTSLSGEKGLGAVKSIWAFVNYLW